MNIQNQVVLSLGSNQGNRLGNLEQALSSIHYQIGTVIQVSKIYETLSWGFESDPFYNAVILIHTHKEPHQILEKIHLIENALGRKQKENLHYEPRPIDIDIICFNEAIISSENLKIPHPLMSERLFVLWPMKDLKWDWKHPVLDLELPALIVHCKDKTVCKTISNWHSPLQNLKLNQFNYIAIEGNIGAGKTTLTQKIAEDFNAKTILERFADNPFLPKFYKDPNRYAFPLEMSFLADRYQQLSDDLAQFDLFKDFIVADYHIFKSLIFAKVTLAPDEYRLYHNLFKIIYREMPKPDLYIYLYQDTNRLLLNIRKRGRAYEQDIPEDYLDKINKGYLDYIKSQTHLNSIIIDISDRDFIQNQEDYLYVLNEIQKGLL